MKNGDEEMKAGNKRRRQARKRKWKRLDVLRERYSTSNGWDYLGNGGARRLRVKSEW